MAEAEVGAVVKGGVCWFEMSISRGARGMEVFVRAAPQIEQFMKDLGKGEKENVAMYGRDWVSLDATDLMVYAVTKTFTTPNTYTIGRASEGFENVKDGKINLTFLRLVGIGEPAGVRFLITDPVSKQYMKRIAGSVIQEVKNFVRDFIVPVQINLRISSQEI